MALNDHYNTQFGFYSPRRVVRCSDNVSYGPTYFMISEEEYERNQKLPRCKVCNGYAVGTHVHNLTEVVVFENYRQVDNFNQKRPERGLPNGSNVIQMQELQRRKMRGE